MSNIKNNTGGSENNGPPSSPTTFMRMLKRVGKEFSGDTDQKNTNGPFTGVRNRRIRDSSGPDVAFLGNTEAGDDNLPPVVPTNDVQKPSWLGGPPADNASSQPAASKKKEVNSKWKKEKQLNVDLPLASVILDKGDKESEVTTVSGVVKGGNTEGKMSSSAPRFLNKKIDLKMGNSAEDKSKLLSAITGDSKLKNLIVDDPDSAVTLDTAAVTNPAEKNQSAAGSFSYVSKFANLFNKEPKPTADDSKKEASVANGSDPNHAAEQEDGDDGEDNEEDENDDEDDDDDSKLIDSADGTKKPKRKRSRKGKTKPAQRTSSEKSKKKNSKKRTTKGKAKGKASNVNKSDPSDANEANVEASESEVKETQGEENQTAGTAENTDHTPANQKEESNEATKNEPNETTAETKPIKTSRFSLSNLQRNQSLQKASRFLGGGKTINIPGFKKAESAKIDEETTKKGETVDESKATNEETKDDKTSKAGDLSTISSITASSKSNDNASLQSDKKSVTSIPSTVTVPQRLLTLCRRGEWLGVEQFLKNVKKSEIPSNLADETTGYTPLMYAVRDNRVIMAEKLIDLGISVNAINKDSKSCDIIRDVIRVIQQKYFIMTTFMRRPSATKILANDWLQLNRSITTGELSKMENMTALFMAAANVKEDMIKLLLARKADPTIACGPKEQLPIHVLCSRSTGAALAPLQLLLRALGRNARLIPDKEGDIPILLAVECGNHGLCKELLYQQVKDQLEARRPSTGDSVVHLASARRDIDLLKFLVEQGASINAQNNDGLTALHNVAHDGDIPTLRYFYNHGADPNLCDKYDRSPLHLAAQSGHNDIIELLIEKFKASIFLRTKDGDTMMHIASKAGFPQTAMIFMKKGVPLHMPNKSGAKCLHTAARSGHADVVRTLLQRGEQVDAATNDNYTALHIAVQANQPQVLEILLGYGARVGIKAGESGETALHIAAKVKKGLKCAELLIKSGAEVNAKQESGETPLHAAAKNGQLDTVNLLLSDGALMDMKTDKGETPLHIAVKNCHFPVASTLLDNWKEQHPDDSSLIVNLQNIDGESAMHYAAALTKKDVHYPTEDRDLIKLLLQTGSDVNMENKAMRETPIHYCSKEGNVDILKEMLEHLSPAEINSAFNRQSKNGWSPLLYASRAGHPVLVTLLLQHSARVDVFDEGGKAALHLAAEYGHDEVVDILLKNKAFVNSRSKKGLTPLHLAAKHGYTNIVQHLVVDHGAVLDALTLNKKTPLHQAAEKGQLDVCSTLLELNADAHAVDNQGQTPLLLAAENDHPEIVKLFLHHKPELVSMANSSGFTCAHIAAMKGSVAVIKELMKFNRHLVTTARNKSNNTALHLAAAGGHAKLVKVLLEAGASATDENGEGYTALHLAAKFGHVRVLSALKSAVSWRITSKKTGMAALHVAASFGQTDFVREVLTQIPANIRSERPSDASSEDYGFTPLHLAADNGHEGTVRVLLNSTGVQTDAATELQGVLALHNAARGGHMAAAGLLLSRSTEQLHAKDKLGRTPLHMAAANGHKDMVGLLLGQGSDINAGDNNGLTALHYTVRHGYIEVVKLLIDSGASPLSQTKEGKVPLCLAAAAGFYDVLKYLLRKEHDTQTLMDDKTFLVDLMVAGKTHDNKPVLDFILVSLAPIDTAVKMARSYQLLALKEKDRARDLENVAVYCEQMAADLLSIAAMSYNTSTLLRAVDNNNTPFLDVLIELQQKEVVAHPAVQKYLSDLWMGSLQWGSWKIVLLFLAFVLCPVTWVACSCPIGHRLANIPIIKFMSYLVSHIFFIFILIFTIINPWVPLWETAKLIPQPQEWLVLLWLIGILVSDVTNPKDREGLGYIKVAIMAVTSMAIFVHFISYLYSGRSKLVTLYARNQLLAVSLLLCFLEFLNFLTFHHLFGPWTVIIRDLIKDLLRFLAILAIFLVGFSLHVCAIYQPVYRPPGNETFSLPVMGQVFQSPVDTFEMLFFALFGLVEPDYLPPMHLSPDFSKIIMKIVFGVYMMVTVIVLINLLIAMMSNTYQRIQAQSDTEWKFGRAKLIRNMNKTSPSPSPINLFTILPTLFCKLCRCKCKRPTGKIPSALQSKRSSVQSNATRVWLARTRERRGKTKISNIGGNLLNNLNLSTISRSRPISRVVDWPMIVTKYLEVTGGQKDFNESDDDAKGD